MAWQVASLASVVVSAAVAVHSSPVIASYFRGKEPWNRFCAMAVLYVITAGAIWILFRLVSNIIDRVKLKEFDRQLGATFGLAKGVLYCIVITFFAVTLSESSRQVVLASHSGDLIARGIRNANPVLPEDVRKYLGEYIDELDKGLHAPPQNSAPQTDGLNPNPQSPPQEAPKQSPKRLSKHRRRLALPRAGGRRQARKAATGKIAAGRSGLESKFSVSLRQACMKCLEAFGIVGCQQRLLRRTANEWQRDSRHSGPAGGTSASISALAGDASGALTDSGRAVDRSSKSGCPVWAPSHFQGIASGVLLAEKACRTAIHGRR